MDRPGGHRHAGAIILNDESTAYEDLKEWLHDYYDIDVEEAEHLTAVVLTDEADVEIAAEYLYAAAHEN